MTSTIKVNNVQNQCGTDIVKRCGATTTVGSGAGNTVVVCGSTVTIGRCGGTVALASGATQTGFGRTGTVDWQTGDIKTATFTAANGEGYFANTSGGAFTMNLPAGSAGNIVSVVDYTNTFQTNFLTIAPNGSDKIGGQSASVNLSTEGQSITLVYVDGNEGWKNVQDSTSNVIGNAFIAATGGTITTCGNDTIHTFTGPGTFTVTKTACCAANNEVSYIVVAGGGAGGGGEGSGGGGAGGFREDKSPVTPYTASPLDGAGPITVSVQGYPITVGAGGAFTGPGPGVQAGSNSVFSTIISAGGGYGGNNHEQPGANGGSGGGGTGRNNANGGSGNTPPTSPPQGNNAGNATTSPTNPDRGGGGGGAGAAGSSVGGCAGADGGNGVSTSINGTPTAYAGGGGGGKDNDSPNGSGAGDGGTGGGGNGGSSDGAPRPSTAGTTNTGGGGGGGAKSCNASSSGGSGIVIIRYKSS